jgi:hypothetical protein
MSQPPHVARTQHFVKPLTVLAPINKPHKNTLFFMTFSKQASSRTAAQLRAEWRRAEQTRAMEGPMTEGTATQSTTSIDTQGDVQFECFKRLEPKIRSVRQEDLMQINLDGTYAVTVVLAAAPRLLALRERMVQLGDEVDLELVDNAAALGYAFSYANADFVRATTPTESLPALHDEGEKLRDLMLASKAVLEKHGLVQGDYLEALKGPVGYRNLSHDLSALVRFYRDNWAQISGKTPLALADVDRASIIAGRLLTGVSAKLGTPAEIDASALLRQQAFTLFVKAYDEVRRAVSFLRWKEGDADEIAPSIYAGRNNGGRRKVQPEAPVTQDTPPTPPTAAAVESPPMQDAPVGHLGSSPYAT